MNKLGSALASGGTSFADEDDPELVKAAVPFGLKLMESLLAESPKHPELLFATASGFTRYAYAFVQEEADELEDRDLNGAMALRERARKLYLRARNYGLRGLEIRHPGFERKLRANSKQALRTTSAKDVPMLYWTAVSWAASISMGKDTPELIADLPLAEAIIDRALELNERFGEGAIHAFLITYEMSRQGAAGDAAARSRRHFERAMEISRGQQAGPLVALAEAVCVQKQDLTEFQSLLHRALAIKADSKPEWRLENLILQRRAKRLLGRTDELFLKKPEDAAQSPEAKSATKTRSSDE